MNKEEPKEKPEQPKPEQPEKATNFKSRKTDLVQPADKEAEAPKTGQTKKQPPRKKGCFKKFCCGCLVVLAIMIILPTYAVTAAGVVKIPILTPLIYGDGPSPTREVRPAKASLKTVSKRLDDAAKADKDQLTVTEEELTALLRKDEQLKDLNLAIDPDGIEIFTYLDSGPTSTHMTVGFQPEIEDGLLDIKFKRFRLGKLTIPVWGLNYAAREAVEQEQQALQQAIKGIEKIELSQGELTITGNLKKMLNQQKDSDKDKGTLR